MPSPDTIVKTIQDWAGNVEDTKASLGRRFLPALEAFASGTPFDLEALNRARAALELQALNKDGSYARPSWRDRLETLVASLREGRLLRTVASRTAWAVIGYGVALAVGA